MGFITWFKSFFNKFNTFVKKAWSIATPFLQEVLSASAKSVLSGLQDLAIEAVKYVGEQGLPTDEAKAKAFREYMEKASHNEIVQLRDSEINLLRETALAIYKKATSTES